MPMCHSSAQLNTKSTHNGMPTAEPIETMPGDGRASNGKNAYNISRIKEESKRYKYREPSKWKRHSFICFDGEGYNINGRHEYVYLAAYDACDVFSIRDENGLGTEACFRFLCNVAATDKYGICVIYGGSYDANMMLRDVPHDILKKLHRLGEARWGDWFIRYAQRKYLLVHHTPTKKTCMLWDVIGFFQASFQSSLEQWLGIVDETIASGKKSRNKFTAKQLDTFIIPYCNKELEYFHELMHALWQALDNAGFKLSRWDGAGAIAGFLFKSRGMAAYKGSAEAQEEHYDKARSAYAGGRFELLRPGDYRQTVYNYDINSAYPYAITLLPEFQPLEHITNLKGYEVSDYDLCYIDYDNQTSFMDAATGGVYSGARRPTSVPGPIHPFFHRATNHSVGYTPSVRRWCWGVEVNTARRCGFQVNVTDIYHWHDSGLRPWSWVGQLYDHRRTLKADGNSAEKAIKLGINSLYGKMVQQKGWHEGEDIPKTHQLYWGGWVTAKTRSMIFEAMCIDAPGVIAVETDGIYTTTKLPLDIGPNLGQWDATVYRDFTYCQSGMYFGTPEGGKAVAKYRGLDKGTLTRDKVLKAYEDYQTNPKTKLTVKAVSTRFRTMGTSLVSEGRMEEWRQWVKETKTVQLDPIMPFRVKGTGKRLHDPFCKEPFGIGHHHNTIPRHISPVESVPYSVLWINPEEKAEYFRELEEQREGAIVDL